MATISSPRGVTRTERESMPAVVERFALQLQREAQLSRLWYHIANEIAGVAAVDRVVVLSAWGEWRVEAVSHLDTPDRRAPLLRAAEQWSAALAPTPHEQWLSTVSELPSLDAPLQAERLVEAGAARSLAWLPLLIPVSSPDTGDAPEMDSECLVGALLLERFQEQEFTLDERELLRRLTRQAAAAVGRSTKSGLRRHWQRWKWPVICSLAAAALAALLLVPADFDLAARGELQPSRRQEVFAPLDGQIRELHIADGGRVKAGQVLLVLDNDELELEAARIAGEIRTARQHLETLEATRLDRDSSASRDGRGSLVSGEVERLKTSLAALQREQALVQSQQARLEVRSPLAGLITTANVEQLLRARPVRTGQRLLTVVQDTGPWEVRLRVADADVGHLLAAQQKSPNLPLRFTLTTEPTVVRSGRIQRIGDWTTLPPGETPYVLVSAQPDEASAASYRPGAEVQARIGCGTRSLGFVWFRRVGEWVQQRLFL